MGTTAARVLRLTDLRTQLQTTLGDAYTLERELGGGGMSRVFVAHEARFGRKVVVKVLAPELAAGVSADRFEREIGVAAQLQHPNIVPVLTAGDTNGLPYYTMPFVEGLSLRSRLARDGALPISQAVSMLRDVARALAYAHERGLVHRDIKPDNILLTGDAAVVTDFGIAKALSVSRTEPGGSLTQTGTSLGTPAYMSPEQVTGEADVDQRSDIYALGATAYEILTGTTVFPETSPHRMMAAHVQQAPAPVASRRPDVPPDLDRLVLRCLEKDPARRPQSAREVLGALDALTTVTPTGASPIAAPSRRWAWIGGALAVAGIAAVAILLTRSRGSGSADAIRSVAVLPFDNVGGDTANAYFADGLAEELTSALSKVSGLRVASPSSAFRFRGAVDLKEVSSALNVGAVLEGSVRREGNRMRLTASLANAGDGSVLWSDTYDREMKDVFSVQDELTQAIVGALQARLSSSRPVATSSASAGSGVRGTSNLEAYDLYLRGLYFMSKRGAGVARAVSYFAQAIDKDSTFARAYAMLATAETLLPLYSFVPRGDAVARALAAAKRALEIDPNLAEAHAAVGFLLCQGAPDTASWNRGMAEFDRAIALDSTYEFSYRGSAPCLTSVGRFDEAIRRSKRDVELNPLDATAHVVLAWSYLMAGQNADALASARRAFELDSTHAYARATLALAELRAGMAAEARESARRTDANPGSGAVLGYVLAKSGDREAAQALVAQFERDRARSAYVNRTQLATYMGLGDTARALAALERAAREHEPLQMQGFTLWDAMFDSIRNSPRFAAAMRAYGLPEDAFRRRPPNRP